MSRTRLLTVAAVVTALAIAFAIVGAQTAPSATVDPTRSGPSEADSTHALTMTLPDGTAVVGEQWNDFEVDYSVAQPSADVSNVGTADIERMGIDRGNDQPGTRVDVRVDKIDTVSAKADGKAVRIATGGNLTLEAGDQVVVVLQNVQNPQNAGTATVNLTVNTQGGATSADGSVTYEQHDATTTFDDQTSAGETVTVQRVNLSEGGFVAIQNASGSDTSAVRGASAYLSPGVHENVQVTLDVPLDGNETLVAQAYTDTNGNQRFDFVDSGGTKDVIYRNGDDNIIGSDQASVTYDPSAGTTTTDSTDSTTTDSTTTTTDSTTTTTTESTDSTSTSTTTTDSTDSTTDSTTTTTTDSKYSKDSPIFDTGDDTSTETTTTDSTDSTSSDGTATSTDTTDSTTTTDGTGTTMMETTEMTTMDTETTYMTTGMDMTTTTMGTMMGTETTMDTGTTTVDTTMVDTDTGADTPAGTAGTDTATETTTDGSGPGLGVIAAVVALAVVALRLRR